MSDDESIEKHEKNVKVFVRILPLERPCDSCAKIGADNKTLFVRCLQDMQRDGSPMGTYPVYWAFRTDGIFHETSQDKVYRATTKDLLQKVLDGINCVLIGYGQTGSGKSFTINGLENNWKHRGIVTRLLSDMFVEKANRREISNICYRLSFVELNGKNVNDLLTAQKRKINVNVNNAFKTVTIVEIEDEVEGLRRLFEAEARRSSVKGATYPVSHLGTSVITFHVSNMSLIKSRAIIATAKIHIVEMAGTGTAGKTGCWKTAMDLGTANLMKMQLEQYFSCLREPSASTCNIARTNNLLKLLKDALTVTSVIRFISHVRITKEDLDVTLSTMRLIVEIARLKPIKTIRHIQPQRELIVQQLREEINALKKELELNDMFLHQEALMNISKSRFEQIRRDIMNFLKGSISELTLFNVSQAQILVKIIKQLYDKLSAKEVAEKKLHETYENTKNALIQAEATSSAPLLKNTVTANIIDSNHIRKENKIVSEVSNDTNGESIEQVGILKKDGITLGPIAEASVQESVTMELTCSIVPKVVLRNNELQMIERAANIRKRFHQLQRTMKRVIEARQEKKKTSVGRLTPKCER